MKNLSVKFKITLWYTVFMSLLIIAVIWLLITTGSSRVLSDAKLGLQDTVLQSFHEITYENGYLDISGAFDSLSEGIYLSAYDASGNLIYGETPIAYEDASLLIMDEIQQIKSENRESSWYLYDYCEYLEGYGNLWIRGVASQTQTDAALRTMVQLALVFLPFCVLCIAAGGYYITRRTLAPLADMTRTAQQISESSDLSGRIRLGTGEDEVHRLAHTFDRMMEKLQISFENEKQFTSDVSHELRTPVTVILSECEYADRNDLTLEEAHGCLGVIRLQARKMSGLISQLLTLARADSGRQKLHLELLNLSELAEVTAEEQKSLALTAGITLNTDIQPDLYVRGDETLLMRLLINLISNSITYGKQGGRILLSLSLQDRQITVKVSDDGMGIRADQLDKIWQRFYQADASRSNPRSGAGLGLPMVKWIVEAHRGRITVASTPGEGSCFTVLLPADENIPAKIQENETL